MPKHKEKMPRKHCWRSRNGVSAIMGEGLLLCVLVVLIGALAYFLGNVPKQEMTVSIMVGGLMEKTQDGNWTLTITNGKAEANGTQLQTINATTGAAQVSAPIFNGSGYFYFNDNSLAGRINGGDVILLNQTAGKVEPGLLVELVKSNKIIFGPVRIPD